MTMNYDYNIIFPCAVIYSGVLLMSWGCHMLCNTTKRTKAFNLIGLILYTRHLCVRSPSFWTVRVCFIKYAW